MPIILPGIIKFLQLLFTSFFKVVATARWGISYATVPCLGFWELKERIFFCVHCARKMNVVKLVSGVWNFFIAPKVGGDGLPAPYQRRRGHSCARPPQKVRPAEFSQGSQSAQFKSNPLKWRKAQKSTHRYSVASLDIPIWLLNILISIFRFQNCDQCWGN